MMLPLTISAAHFFDFIRKSFVCMLGSTIVAKGTTSWWICLCSDCAKC